MANRYLRYWLDKWLKRRLPAKKNVRLNSGNTFILPSKTGWHFLISCLILFLLGTNYQNNLILFLVFFQCSFMVTCLLLSYQNLAGLKLSAVSPDMQFSGQDSQFLLRLTHTKTTAKAMDFKFQHGCSLLSSVVETEKVSLYALSNERGYFNPGRVTISSTFPFGLFTVWTHLDFDFKVLLYPKPIENSMSTMSFSPAGRDDAMNQAVAGVDQFSMLKNYQVGESLKSVAWKQLAQGRGWFSKQFEQSSSGEMSLDIETLTQLPLEMRLSYLCYQVLELDKKQLRYSLSLFNQKIPAGAGDSHKKRCLAALALYEEER